MRRSVDIGKALTYHFEDPKWIEKLLLGGLIAMVPILNFALIGYELSVVRAVSRDEFQGLPKWDDVGAMFMDGLKLGLARALLSLPVVLAVMGGVLFYFFGILLTIFASEQGGGEEAAFPFLLIAIAILMTTMCLAWGFSLVLALFMPAVQANYVRWGTFTSCFNVKAAFDLIRRNFSNYLLVYLTGLAAGMVWFALYMVISFIPCLNYILIFAVGLPGMVWMMTAQSHALGQLLAIDALDSAPAVTTS